MGTLTRSDFKELSLVERLKAIKERPSLLLDISGSMKEEIEPGRSKIDALRDIVSGLPDNINMIAFNTQTYDVSKNSIPDPFGGTKFSPALKSSGDKVVMITDGGCENGDKQASLDAVKGKSLEIFYVGREPKPAFLDELSKAANGKCSIEDLRRTKELTEKVTLLLGSSKSDKNIQL